MELPVHSDGKIRILAVDEQPLFLAGLRVRLAEVAEEIEVIDEAHDLDTAHALAASLEPHVILMEMSLKSSKLTSLEMIEKIKAELPESKILILSSDDSVDSIMGAIRAGASGYLLKSVGIQELKEAILTVTRDGSSLSPDVAKKLLSILSHPAVEQFVPTEKEFETLNYLALGLTNKEIANEMFISERTVEVHINHLFQKLAVTSRTAAVMAAIAQGFVTCPKSHKNCPGA